MTPPSLSARIKRAFAAQEDRWYVTDGSRVVGPLRCELLLRGIAGGRIPNGCGIAAHGWSDWRPPSQVREVRALGRMGKKATERAVELALHPRVDTRALEGFRSAPVLLERAMRLALATTGAGVGVLHMPRAPYPGLVTACTLGPGMREKLGEVVARHDSARQASDRAGPLVGLPEQHEWARSAAGRLCNQQQRVRGVALLPVSVLGHSGLLELGRFDHPFRESDATALAKVGEQLSQRLQQRSSSRLSVAFPASRSRLLESPGVL